MKITKSKLRVIIREELSRKLAGERRLLNEVWPVLLLVGGGTLTATEVAAALEITLAAATALLATYAAYEAGAEYYDDVAEAEKAAARIRQSRVIPTSDLGGLPGVSHTRLSKEQALEDLMVLSVAEQAADVEPLGDLESWEERLPEDRPKPIPDIAWDDDDDPYRKRNSFWVWALKTGEVVDYYFMDASGYLGDPMYSSYESIYTIVGSRTPVIDQARRLGYHGAIADKDMIRQLRDNAVAVYSGYEGMDPAILICDAELHSGPWEMFPGALTLGDVIALPGESVEYELYITFHTTEDALSTNVWVGDRSSYDIISGFVSLDNIEGYTGEDVLVTDHDDVIVKDGVCSSQLRLL